MPALSRVAFLCHQKWDSASKLARVPARTPILMLSGLRDEVVPPAHMRELERILRAPVVGTRRPGKMVEFPEGTHSEWDLVFLF